MRDQEQEQEQEQEPRPPISHLRPPRCETKIKIHRPPLRGRLRLDISAPSGNLAAMNTVSERAEPESTPGLVVSFQNRLARQFQVQVADWLDTCRNLAIWEDRTLVVSSPPDRLTEHAAMLDQLERAGHWLAAAAVQFSSDLGSSNDQIQLTLQDLRDSRSMWHGTVPSARKQEILRDCFNES